VTTSPLPELSACLLDYGLSADGPVRPLAGGNVSRAWMVPTARRPVAVKRFAARFDAARVSLAVAAHQHAAIAGLAPPLLRNSRGELLSQTAGGRFIVTEYVASADRADPLTFAAALADLHNRLASFVPIADCPGFLELPDPPQARLEELRGQRSQARNAEMIERRLRILHAVGLDAPTRAGLGQPWVHGDARPDNLLLAQDSGRRLFIDFDQVSCFPRSYELLRSFFACIRPELSATDLPGADLPAQLRGFLAVYHAKAPLPAAERAIMIDFYLTVQAAESRTFTTRSADVQGMPAFAQARHSHRDTLRRAVAGDSR
jgi:Ser/Thr protein kinase RdoA (MazF antagonist)